MHSFTTFACMKEIQWLLCELQPWNGWSPYVSILAALLVGIVIGIGATLLSQYVTRKNNKKG